MKLDLINPETGDLIVGNGWISVVCEAGEEKTFKFANTYFLEQNLKYSYICPKGAPRYNTTSNNKNWLPHKGYKTIK